MPSRANLAIYQGDDYFATVNVFACGVAQDLTGYTVQAQIRTAPADQAPDVVVEIPTLISGSQVKIQIPATSTVLLRNPPYVWDLQLTDPAGIIATALAGAVIVTLEVTREAPALA